jgi:hypothetical protein
VEVDVSLWMGWESKYNWSRIIAIDLK